MTQTKRKLFFTTKLFSLAVGSSVIYSFSSTAFAMENDFKNNSKNYSEIATKHIEEKQLNDISRQIKNLASDLKTKDLNKDWKKEIGLLQYGYYGATLVPHIVFAPFSVTALGLSVMGGQLGPPTALGLFGGMHFSSLYTSYYGMNQSTNSYDAIGYVLLSYLPFLVVVGLASLTKK